VHSICFDLPIEILLVLSKECIITELIPLQAGKLLHRDLFRNQFVDRRNKDIRFVGHRKRIADSMYLTWVGSILESRRVRAVAAVYVYSLGTC